MIPLTLGLAPVSGCGVITIEDAKGTETNLEVVEIVSVVSSRTH